MDSKQQDDKQEYISISEFARLTGKSRTTVYKYLDSFLSTYVQQDAQGKKVISRAAVKVFGVTLDMIIFVALFTRAKYSISMGLLDSYIVYKGGSVCSQN